eukprot:gnl/TRDRNA2_/TRDRNA2_137107_c1_seq4.p1 gnl/TRDRNA2_/TRDRNA2_137107_c1~~gnl/TRDRNA2_/TRDRNA2_137107_c1_seq4.p1  ORF type:complete len:188 (+),score=24.62 gnl/TRDRNA2_/TRDRNA2_137107_c1_seq4:129-692(+)
MRAAASMAAPANNPAWEPRESAGESSRPAYGRDTAQAAGETKMSWSDMKAKMPTTVADARASAETLVSSSASRGALGPKFRDLSRAVEAFAHELHSQGVEHQKDLGGIQERLGCLVSSLETNISRRDDGSAASGIDHDAMHYRWMQPRVNYELTSNSLASSTEATLTVRRLKGDNEVPDPDAGGIAD